MKYPARLSLLSLLLCGFVAGGLAGETEINEHLEGAWSMDDKSPALMYPANKANFVLLRVAPGKSTWADGTFFLRWPNAARPERGYYNLETGRVWITTYRWVNQKEQRVEYRGVVERNDEGEVTWTGTATTTGSGKVTWKFAARKN